MDFFFLFILLCEHVSKDGTYLYTDGHQLNITAIKQASTESVKSAYEKTKDKFPKTYYIRKKDFDNILKTINKK